MTTVSNPAEKAKLLREKIDGHLDELAQAVDEIRASETFKAYLDVQARFYRYSWRNSMLILMQCPNASRVAGFRAWLDFGRHVRKGEKGISILAPCPFKKERENPQTGEAETVAGMFFKVTHVFDVSQTDGDELPNVEVPVLQGDAAGLLAALEAVAAGRKLSITYGALGGPFGQAIGGDSIAIDNTYPTAQQAKTLAHEIAHCALHFGKTDRATRLTRDIAELEAESIAYVVGRHFGLDCEVRCSRYIALWNGDSKALRESLERIAEAARAMIDEMEAVNGADRKAVAA